MCRHAWLYRLLACMDLSELSAPAELVTKGARVLVRKSSIQQNIDAVIVRIQIILVCNTYV